MYISLLGIVRENTSKTKSSQYVVTDTDTAVVLIV